jgi:hypothetical protein
MLLHMEGACMEGSMTLDGTHTDPGEKEKEVRQAWLVAEQLVGPQHWQVPVLFDIDGRIH